MPEGPPRSPRSPAQVLDMLRETRPELLEAAREVDRSLLEWSLGLSPLERLDACTRATRALAGFRRVTPPRS